MPKDPDDHLRLKPQKVCDCVVDDISNRIVNDMSLKFPGFEMNNKFIEHQKLIIKHTANVLLELKVL